MNNTMKKRILSFLLIFMIAISPFTVLAADSVNISYKVVESEEEVAIKIIGEKNRQASITIKNDSKYFLIDQKKLDDEGILEFRVALPSSDKYTLSVNIDGLVTTKLIDRTEKLEPSTPTPVSDKVNINIRGYKGQVLSGEYELKAGDTVLSFTRRVLDSKKIAYEDRGGYLASIDGQAEMDKGKNSGWLYTVNGKLANVGAGSIELKDGDNLVWKYTLDYKEDEAKIDDKNTSTGNNTNNPSNESKESLTSVLNKDRKAIEKQIDLYLKENYKPIDDSLKKTSKIIELKKDGEIILSKDFMSVVREKEIDKIGLESNNCKIYLDVDSLKTDRDIKVNLDNKDKISLNIMYGNEKIESLSKFVKLELAVKDFKNPSGLRIKDEKGNILAGLYDSKNKTFVFRTRTLGEYRLEEKNISFKDIKNHWSRKDVESLASKGIVKGISEDLFEANRDITRAEFVALINRIMDFEKVDMDLSFTDVSEKDWFKEDIATVSSLGIVKGRGDSTFDPNGKISRQEMSTIVGRILDMEGYKKVDILELDRYKDRNKISVWAEEGLASLSKFEIIKGDKNGNVNPRDNATRGEATAILSRLYSLILFD